MPFRQGQFQYQDVVVAALEGTQSADRLSTCLEPAGFDKARAIRLYVWNCYVAQCLHLPLQVAEVTIRNTLNDFFVSKMGTAWPQSDAFLNLVPEVRSRTIDAITKVTRRIDEDGYPVTTGRIVAGLPFDFWVGLFTGKYERPLWQTQLHRVFPHLPKHFKRKHFYELLRAIKGLRNRVAHYEPVFQRDLSKAHTDIVSAICYRCPHTAAWVNAHSHLQLALRSKP